MRLTTITSSLLAFCTLSHASIKLSYAPETDRSDQIVLGENVRIAWETDKTYVCIPCGDLRALANL
jgi:hypothetical protein